MRASTCVIGSALLTAAVLVLAGCATGTGVTADTTPVEVSTPSPIATPTLTPTPTPTPPPPNLLSPQRVAEITQTQCPGAIDAPTVESLVQNAADAVDFFAATGQCGDIAAVLAFGDTAPVFASPLQYVDAACPTSTVLSVWAHYDDDLIFGNPTAQNAIAAGDCVRTFFLTIGDAGQGMGYAGGRENGIRAAYDVMRGSDSAWVDRTVLLRNGLSVTLTRPVDDPRVSLLMLRLPDGGMAGTGYEATGWQSLPKLFLGEVGSMSAVDTGQTLTFEHLWTALAELHSAYTPRLVMGPVPGSSPLANGDHPDHRTTGRVLTAAIDNGAIDPAITMFAQGYPVAHRPENIGGWELDTKVRVFAVYSDGDPVVRCGSADPYRCLSVNRFGAWLKRQYLIPHGEL